MLDIGTAATLHPHNPSVVASANGQEHHEHHGTVVSHVRHPKAKSRSMLGIGTADTLHPHNPRVVASAVHGRNIMSIMALSFLM